jgi:hypothetical protein
MSQFTFLGTTGRNQNLIQEEIKRRLNYSNACCVYVIGRNAIGKDHWEDQDVDG